MIKVLTEVKLYEVDGHDAPISSEIHPLLVLSHWNRDSMVRLKHGTLDITVLASDLTTAITNATRTNR